MEEDIKTLVQNYFENQFPKNAGREELQEIIDKSVNLKLNSYFVFLMTKLGLEELKHRKIVYRIFSKYILK